MRRLWRFLGAAMLAVGLLMVLAALTVYLTQGSQIHATATVTAEHCHPQFDLGTGTTSTRCEAAIRYQASDPSSPFKQSNYMPLGQFLLVLGLGLVAAGAGTWWLARADRIARKAVSRRAR